MSDEEDDYMSDKFLKSDVQSTLIRSVVQKRRVEVEEKRKELIKRQRDERLARKGVITNEQLEESLKRPIEEENKGFQLLAKMGYKAGQALGKNVQDAENTLGKGITEPIALRIKTDRGGLGREAALRESCKEARVRGLHENEVSAEEFRKRATQKAEERFVSSALMRCQSSCKSLDLQAGLTMPKETWFWPERPNEALELEEDENSIEQDQSDNEEQTNSKKLELLIDYLRSSYSFCFWCGIRYTDDVDLNNNCPGNARDDH